VAWWWHGRSGSPSGRGVWGLLGRSADSADRGLVIGRRATLGGVLGRFLVLGPSSSPPTSTAGLGRGRVVAADATIDRDGDVFMVKSSKFVNWVMSPQLAGKIRSLATLE